MRKRQNFELWLKCLSFFFFSQLYDVITMQSKYEINHFVTVFSRLQSTCHSGTYFYIHAIESNWMTVKQISTYNMHVIEFFDNRQYLFRINNNQNAIISTCSFSSAVECLCLGLYYCFYIHSVFVVIFFLSLFHSLKLCVLCC